MPQMLMGCTQRCARILRHDMQKLNLDNSTGRASLTAAAVFSGRRYHMVLPAARVHTVKQEAPITHMRKSRMNMPRMSLSIWRSMRLRLEGGCRAFIITWGPEILFLWVILHCHTCFLGSVSSTIFRHHQAPSRQHLSAWGGLCWQIRLRSRGLRLQGDWDLACGLGGDADSSPADFGFLAGHTWHNSYTRSNPVDGLQSTGMTAQTSQLEPHTILYWPRNSRQASGVAKKQIEACAQQGH